MYCRNCGAEIIESYSHCYKCRGAHTEPLAGDGAADAGSQELTALQDRGRAHNRKVWIVLATVILMVAAVLTRYAIYTCKYNNSLALYFQKDYMNAAVRFSAIGDYNDAPVMVTECNYCYSKQMMDRGDFEKAIDILSGLGQYKDSATLLTEARYGLGKHCFELKQYERAIEVFTQIKEYRDSGQYIANAKLDLISQYDGGQIDSLELLKILIK